MRSSSFQLLYFVILPLVPLPYNLSVVRGTSAETYSWIEVDSLQYLCKGRRADNLLENKFLSKKSCVTSPKRTLKSHLSDSKRVDRPSFRFPEYLTYVCLILAHKSPGFSSSRTIMDA